MPPMTAAAMSPTAAPVWGELILSQLDAVAAWRTFPATPAFWASRKSIALRNPSEAIVALKRLFETTADPRARGGLNRQAFWKHAIAVACAARALVESEARDVSGGLAFGAGLLHDIGKVALDSALPKSYARVLQRTAQCLGDISDIEREILGVDHATAGRHLAQRWGLPQPI